MVRRLQFFCSIFSTTFLVSVTPRGVNMVSEFNGTRKILKWKRKQDSSPDEPMIRSASVYQVAQLTMYPRRKKKKILLLIRHKDKFIGPEGKNCKLTEKFKYMHFFSFWRCLKFGVVQSKHERVYRRVDTTSFLVQKQSHVPSCREDAWPLSMRASS